MRAGTSGAPTRPIEQVGLPRATIGFAGRPRPSPTDRPGPVRHVLRRWAAVVVPMRWRRPSPTGRPRRERVPDLAPIAYRGSPRPGNGPPEEAR